MADEESSLSSFFRRLRSNKFVNRVLLSCKGHSPNTLFSNLNPNPNPRLISPCLFKAFFLLRLASASAPYLLSSETLHMLEVIEQHDRDHSLAPSPSLQLAYASVAVAATATFLKGDEDEREFIDAVETLWGSRVSDLESSEELRGLLSEKLREERILVEEAAVSGVARQLLMRRDTAKEALEAILLYVEESLEASGCPMSEEEAMPETGPMSLEKKEDTVLETCPMSLEEEEEEEEVVVVAAAEALPLPGTRTDSMCLEDSSAGTHAMCLEKANVETTPTCIHEDEAGTPGGDIFL